MSLVQRLVEFSCGCKLVAHGEQAATGRTRVLGYLFVPCSAQHVATYAAAVMTDAAIMSRSSVLSLEDSYA